MKIQYDVGDSIVMKKTVGAAKNGQVYKVIGVDSNTLYLKLQGGYTGVHIDDVRPA